MNIQTHLLQAIVTRIIFLVLVFGFLIQLNIVHAENYADWKAKQQQQDERLKIQTPSVNHYLAKPTLDVPQGNKININTATLEQLQQLKGIGQKKAEAIVDYRKKNGKFKSIADVQNVKGIGPTLFAKNQARLAI